MNSFAALTVLVLAVVHLSVQDGLTEEQQKRIAQYRADCIKEIGVNPELIEKADNGNFVEDDKLKCFTKCFYQKAGFIDDKGEILIDVIKSKIPEGVDKDKALEVIETCKKHVGANTCETAYLVHKCYFEHNRKYHEAQAAAAAAAAKS